ncbi:hypothetical protein KJ819_00590 [Patescibacteria group bacterium]|nr:hypothetical protein [Patescibacteria group bacterium]MBU1501134.1 hypothetical protein [Patescibacteria group bacterium]MBU2080993.1 hypothetical protein [Patescibacteria group bacterium]MBU2124085.1 hypothetical protein [Patescibacteria group bacterium]MBU2194940.1 hypothetical protein [Patescibacteria group bacterium]
MKHLHQWFRKPSVALISLGLAVVLIGTVVLPFAFATTYESGQQASTEKPPEKKVVKAFDKEAYDARMELIANYASTTPTTTPRLWPVKAAYPNVGALLPNNRIIAYYGNFYSTRMGVLGEYPEDVMLAKLREEQRNWELADPATPTIPAINYIAITAQENPGREGKYLLRMPDTEIDKALEIAKKVDGIVILDIQIGFSSLEYELPLLEKYLAMPNVHLGLDPEFHMIGEESPGHVIGSYDARHINYAAEYMAKLVREHNLPPKVLIVHRFTQRMVTNAALIKPLPEVQIIMDMDGWGPPAKKINTYKQFIYPEPVQFTGFKIFYKNDLKPPSTRLLTPKDLLELTPQPLFIQYQ